ncbi:MAG: NAD(P)/FAD-dependent oxidoreductase, partial [Candidatus Cybelea sp.]
ASRRVVVLEARDRAGGRVLPYAGIDGSWVDLGAEFIHGSAALTYDLLREAGLAWDDVEGERWIAAPGGALQPRNDSFASDPSLFDALREVQGDVSVDEFFRRFAGDAAMQPRIEAARAFLEGFDAADPRIASARGIAAEWRSGVDERIARPRESYRPLFEYLYETALAAGAEFHFGAIVARIIRDDNGVAVEMRDKNGAHRAFRAHACVVTLPTGVLRDSGDAATVTFEPALPPEKRAALQAIETGDAIRVVLWFSSRFWERIDGGRYRDAAFFQARRGPFTAYWSAIPRRNNAVVAWSAGPNAAMLRDAGEDARIDAAVRGFGALFGDEELARSQLVAGAAHDWRADPFARGAYSYLAVGGTGAREVLGAPVAGRLFFAGEATALDGEGGTVNGALRSGERAAGEVEAAHE